MKKILSWIKNNQREFLVILAIILVAAFLRFYRISEYMTFLGDEGRDALVVKRILTTYDIPLLGPATSVGNMYLGPLYYYMMTVAMTFFYLNPVAAAGMDALIGVLVVGLVYYLSRKWFGKAAGGIAATLYALSPVNIIYSRSSWNPNPAPFFALLGFWAIDKTRDTKNFYWFILVGIALAFAVQMHYLALILTPVFFILWLYELFNFKKKKIEYINFWKGTIYSVLSFLFLMSPLVIFDLKHNFMNFRAISTFFGNRETTVNLNILNTLGRVLPIYQETLIGRYITGENLVMSILIAVLILIPILFVLIASFKKRKIISWPILALGIWLGVGVMGLTLYKQTIYDHYLGFLNPAPFILIGSLTFFTKYLKGNLQKKIFLGAVFLLGIILIIISIQKSPLQNPPNRQLQRTQEVSKFVIDQSGNKPFNFALLAEHNYDSAYQFYLDIYGHKPKQIPFEITDQLFVVCEDAVCNPVNNAKYEIAGFGWVLVDWEKEFDGVKIFRLIHNPQEKK